MSLPISVDRPIRTINRIRVTDLKTGTITYYKPGDLALDHWTLKYLLRSVVKTQNTIGTENFTAQPIFA